MWLSGTQCFTWTYGGGEPPNPKTKFLKATDSIKLVAAGEALLQAAAKYVAGAMSSFSSQHIAVTLWSFAKLAYDPGADMLDKATRHCLRLMAEFNPQNIANTLWSFATLGQYPARELLDQCVERALQIITVSIY